MKALTFTDWLNESERPLKKLSELEVNRKIPIDKYETELFPRFQRLKAKLATISKKPTIDEFFAWMQRDNEFYSRVMGGEFAQPDIRELWRDYTGRRSAHMKQYGRK